MKHLVRCLFVSILISALISAASAPTAFAQEVFDDPEGKYTISLPAGWLAIVSQDSLGRNEVNIVYRNNENGSLKLRRVDNVDASTDIMDFAKEDENNTIRFRPAYNKLSMEKFLSAGGKSGVLLSYNYNNAAGQPFSGRIYYLKLNDSTIYVLTFTGRRNVIGTLRNQTDSIARSLKLKEVQ